MKATAEGFVRSGVLLVVALLLHPFAAWSLPAPGPLVFMNPTPADGATVSTATINARLDASCTVDPTTLAVSLNGTSIPVAGFLPFSTCSGGRKQSQTVVVSLTLPNTTITAGPSTLTAGQSATYTASATAGGDTFNWNFDGGAQPGTGSSLTRTFNPAGQFTVSVQATSPQNIAVSAIDTGNLVGEQRPFRAADPTPDTRVLAVAMPPDVDFENFETAQIHPLQLSAAGDKLYAVNTSEARLAIFNVAGNGALSYSGDVPVGLDPVSAAVRPGTNEVWVVNHLSDSVSVVDAAARTIIDTIQVGDEPNDVAFANGRAFVTLGGNQDVVKVYNSTTRALLTTIAIFGDDPRSLAVNAAGTEVYAVVFESGNQTTELFADLV